MSGFYINSKSLAALETKKQTIIPVIVGSKKEISVHLMLWVSFFIVRQVVAHGKCNNENNITQSAVIQVQPFATSKLCNSERLWYSVKLPVDIYAINIIGITISLAGNPNIKANKITPSNPISLANGSRKFAQCIKMLKLST